MNYGNELGAEARRESPTISPEVSYGYEFEHDNQ